MKKGLRLYGSISSLLEPRSNADLMKKGLRLQAWLTSSLIRFERGPDEEGIETGHVRLTQEPFVFERGPDEEGIETAAGPEIPPPTVVRTRT